MSVALTWFGHATVLVEDRARVLTDPLLTSTLMHLHRRAGTVPPSLTGRVDAVVVSHLHMDHLHLPSLAMIDPGTPVLLPRGASQLLRGLPLEPVEVVAGDVVPVGDAEVLVVPAVHDSTRWPLVGRVRGDAVGYIVRGDATTYFAGDTSYFSGMGTFWPALDAALLPVGGWGPSLRGDHMNPEDAARCLDLVAAPVAVPIHYGTFWPRGMGWARRHLFHNPGRDFAEHARELSPQVDVRVLAPGTSTVVDPAAR